MKNKYEKIITLTTELYKENEILKENAENNDKVVDKINWENQLLKKENKQLKDVINKAIEYINKYENIKAYYEYIDEDGYDEYNYDEDFKKELIRILQGEYPMKTREDEILNLKKIIKLFYNPDFKGGLYNSRNVVGDKMTNIYKSKNMQLDICYEYDYFEVFGLTEEEFKDLQNYYSNLKSRY